MRIVVDLNRCQGYAQCVFLAPDVFELRGDEALHYDAFGQVSEHGVRGAAERTPCARSGGAVALLPDQFTPQQEPEVVFEDPNHIR